MSEKKHNHDAQNAEHVNEEHKVVENAEAAAPEMNQEAGEELEIPEHSESAEASVDLLTKQMDELQKKYDALNNDYLRLMADFDNFRKRTMREKADLLKYGSEDALKKLLPVVDDFERAMNALENSDDIKAVKEGVELIYNKFRSYLENNGVKEIPAVGEAFDLDVHEAITTFPAPTPEQKGKIIDCMTKGYTLNDKVIRHSKVVVGE